ncbi:unnamed protein product [Spirodela intermedia]|uniref:Protein RER1 n=1 Tax=Spirodela intermedia TaxID=51605 RepID=A0A7I8JSY8_SPIIN|nr:unnamed protein product [Spirodela intermedia]CAA6673239.1 unnamed protein product [Spirodela intermedia]
MEAGSSGKGDGAAPTALAKWGSDVSRVFQYYLDRSTPHTPGRWLGTLAIAMVYTLRSTCYRLLHRYLRSRDLPYQPANRRAFVTYRGSDEFKPFMRRLPEFKFWYAITKAFLVAFVMTFFSAFDVPCSGPFYCVIGWFFFFLTMKRQILHMIKYKYIPFNVGKQKYTGKKARPGTD